MDVSAALIYGVNLGAPEDWELCEEDPYFKPYEEGGVDFYQLLDEHFGADITIIQGGYLGEKCSNFYAAFKEIAFTYDDGIVVEWGAIEEVPFISSYEKQLYSQFLKRTNQPDQGAKLWLVPRFSY